MTLSIDIPTETSTRLKAAAARQGIDESSFAKLLIERGLSMIEPPSSIADRATLELLAQWDAQDDCDDPSDLARREAAWEEFKKSMNEHSLSGRAVYP